MLASATPRGQAFLTRQQRIIDICAHAWHATAMRVAEVCQIDALFARDDCLFRHAEIKAREMTWRELQGWGSYLVSFDKLEAGRDLATHLHSEFVLIVGLSDATLWWPITDTQGAWLAEFRVVQSTTQATCNGGSATRANAYLSLRGVQRLRGIE